MKLKIIILSVMYIACTSCGSPKNNSNEDTVQADAVSFIKDSRGNEVLSVNVSKLGKIKDLPLSELIEDLNIVKLDNDPLALIGGNQAVKVYDDYILVSSREQNPVKLFDKNGKFISTIGAYGRGPNEYMNIYDFRLDPENGIVYILPWNASQVLRYKINGDPLNPIKLAHNSPKGVFNVDTDAERLTMFVLPFSNAELISWVQDFSGNIISSVPMGTLAVHPDYSNEVYADVIDDELFASTFVFYGDERIDTLYKVETSGKLKPEFTVNFGDGKRTMHSFRKLKNHYVVELFQPKKLSERITGTQNHKIVLVDDKGTEARLVNIYDDLISSSGVAYFDYKTQNGKYIMNYDPGVLLEEIEKGVKSDKLSSEAKERLKLLESQIDENGNNYIIWADLK